MVKCGAFLLMLFFQSVIVGNMNVVVGEPFMVMEGKTLSKNEVRLPDYFGSRVTFVAFGFSRHVQADFDSWLTPLKKRYSQDSRFFFIEIPMVGPRFKIGRIFIESGMRSGIDESLHDHVMSYYEKTAPFRSFYGFSEKKKGYFALVDSQGIIVWQNEGVATDEMLDELYDIVELEFIDG